MTQILSIDQLNNIVIKAMSNDCNCELCREIRAMIKGQEWTEKHYGIANYSDNKFKEHTRDQEMDI